MLRFWEGLTQAEIGVRIGVTQTQVSRILARACDELRGTVGRVVDEAALGPEPVRRRGGEGNRGRRGVLRGIRIRCPAKCGE